MEAVAAKSRSKNSMIELWRVVFSLLIVACHTTALPKDKTEDFLWCGFFIYSVRFSNGTVSRSPPPRGGGGGKASLRFVISKIRPILPTYLFALCTELFVASFVGAPQKRSLSELVYYVWDILFLRTAGLQGDSMDVAVGASWYLSAMILAMWMLYPLLCKFREIFLYVLAPLLSIFMLGWFSNVYGKINFSLAFCNGICLGLLRAVAEICVGCCSYVVCTHLRELAPKGQLIRAAATIGELGSFGAVLWAARHCYRSQTDFICILLVAVGIALSFSGLSFTSLLNGKINVRWAGRFSLALYLNHVVWVRMLSRWKLPISFRKQTLIVFVLSIATAIVCNWVTGYLPRRFNNFKKHIRSI